MKKPVLISALLVAVALPPFVCNSERKSIEEEDRLGQGTFLPLADGVTHYQALGNPDAPAVILVHGFSVPYFVFDHVAAGLMDRFYVVRYDLFGRGLSDRPDTAYNQDLFDRQLLGLMDELGLGKAALVGSSMGGLIAAEFTARHPERVKRLALIAPAGFLEKIPASARLARLPLAGDYIVYSLGDVLFTRSNRANFYGDIPPDFAAKFSPQMRYRGYKRALLSTLRNMPLETGAPSFDRAGKTPIPKLLIWGREDAVVPFANAENVRSRLAGVEFHALERAGHVPHFEMPDRVVPILRTFLAK